MIQSVWKDVHRLYANTLPFYIKNLGTCRFWYSWVGGFCPITATPLLRNSCIPNWVRFSKVWFHFHLLDYMRQECDCDRNKITYQVGHLSFTRSCIVEYLSPSKLPQCIKGTITHNEYCKINFYIVIFLLLNYILPYYYFYYVSARLPTILFWERKGCPLSWDGSLLTFFGAKCPFSYEIMLVVGSSRLMSSLGKIRKKIHETLLFLASTAPIFG